MNVKTWSEIFNEFGKTKPSRVGQVSPRRAAATYKQIEEQQKLNEETYAVPNGLYVKHRGENV